MSMLGDILRRLTKLEAKVKAQQPQGAPGALVTQTPRGVSVRPLAKAGSQGNNSTVPTWG